jgi:SAM-dependent methyltransferase
MIVRKTKRLLQQIPVLGPLVQRTARLVGWKSSREFSTSGDYWESRYQSGGNSGDGSYNELARFKAATLNDFVREQSIQSVVEFGCGDGNQLRLSQYPSYVGYDVSPTAVEMCRKLFAGDLTKRFDLVENYAGEVSDMSMSLDVLYHLIEDDVFESYIRRLFGAGERFVIIYSSNYDASPASSAPHVRHRKFTSWIDLHQPNWRLMRHLPNEYPADPKGKTGSFADFYFYQRNVGGS